MALQYCSQAGMICERQASSAAILSHGTRGWHGTQGRHSTVWVSPNGLGKNQARGVGLLGMKLGRRAAVRNYCRRHSEYNSMPWCFHWH